MVSPSVYTYTELANKDLLHHCFLEPCPSHDPMATSMFSDMGKTDVLVISSEPASSNPLVVSHRPSSGLTHAEVVKLENQGVGKESHAGDCSIMKARYGLDKDCYMWEVEKGRLSTVEVRKKIATLFSVTKNPSGE